MTRTLKTSALALACLTLLSAQLAHAAPPESPTHTATIYLQVLPPPGSDPANFKQEDITRIINRQIQFIKSDSVIDRILLQDELQHDLHDPTSNKKSRWLTENIADARKHLREAIEIVTHPNSDVFSLQFTASDRLEAARILNAIHRTYRDSLSNELHVAQMRTLDNSSKQLEEQEQQVLRLESSLHDFCRANNVDPTARILQGDLNLLAQMKLDYFKAQQTAIAAGSQYEAIKKQSETNTLTLPAEAERQIESDPQLLAIAQTQLQLQLDQAALPENAPAETAAALKRRLDTAATLLNDRRARLTAAAKVHLQEQAEADTTHAMTQLEFLKKSLDRQSLDVKDATTWLAKAQTQTEALNTEKAVLAKLREKFANDKLRGGEDESPVRQIGGEATPPD